MIRKSRERRNGQSVVVRIIFIVLATYLMSSVSVAGTPKPKRKRQSGFETADKKRVSSSEFIKMLKEHLDNKYQDLEIIINSCKSGEFTDAASDPNHGLEGDWSVSTAADTKNVAKVKPSWGDKTEDGADGNPYGGLKGDTKRHHGSSTRHYHGYNAQWIKAAQEGKDNVGNKELHETAKDRNYNSEQNPQYASSGEEADEMTLHGGTLSNHAIIFSQPPYKGSRDMANQAYKALKGAEYDDDDIDYCRGGAEDQGQDNVDRRAGKKDLEDAIKDLAAKLAENPGEEKALIWIDAHGFFEPMVVAYALGSDPEQPGNGAVISPTDDSVTIEGDSDLTDELMEDTNQPGGGVWADDPNVQRIKPAFLSFAASSESFTGTADVDIYLNDVFLETVTFGNEPNGGEYDVNIPDSVINNLIPTLESDPNITVRFDFDSAGDSFVLATDADFYYDPCYSFSTYGVGIGVVFGANEVTEEGDYAMTVEDFEGYRDPNAPFIHSVWQDGAAGPGGGNATDSTLALSMLEQYYGAKSMEVSYNNSFSTSEVGLNYLDLPDPCCQDWTGDINVVTLWFKGALENDAEYIWLELESCDANEARVYYDESCTGTKRKDGTLQTNWTEWNVDLADFAGVDMSQVKRLTIGLGDNTIVSSGTIYVDDILLCWPKCAPECTGQTGDLDGDCAVNFKDFALMAENWLEGPTLWPQFD